MKYLFLLLCFACTNASAQIKKLEPGLYKSGFISLTRFDASRPAIKEQPVKDKGRIIQLNIWYPSYSNDRQLCFVDYVHLAGKELDSSETNNNWKQNGIDKYFAWPQSMQADKKMFIDFLNEKKPMAAFANARPLAEKFPLILLIHGFAADHAYLAEYLSSYGYIVLQVPVKGTAAYELDYEGKGLETQVTDYEFACAVVQKEFSFYTNQQAVAGFSFGGQSAAAYALRHANVQCLLSFDGGIGSAFGAALLQQQPYYNSAKITQPILHLYNSKDKYTDLNWFNTIKTSSRFLAAMHNMEHGHFTSFGLLNNVVPGLMGVQPPDPGNGYEALMVLTKQFLDASFKNMSLPDKDFFKDMEHIHAFIKPCIETTKVIERGS